MDFRKRIYIVQYHISFSRTSLSLQISFTRAKFWCRHTGARLGIFSDALLQVNIRVTAVRAAPVSSRGRRGSIETVVSDAGKTLARKFIGYSEMNSAGRSSVHIHEFCH